MDYIATHLKRALNIESIVSIHYYEYTSDFAYPGEAHDFWEIIYCDKGILQISADDRSYTLSRGQAFLHPPKQYHNVRTMDKRAASSIILSFYSDCPDLYGVAGKIIEFDDYAVSALLSIIREAQICFDNPLGFVMESKLNKRGKNEVFASEQVIQNYIELLFIHLIRRHDVIDIFPEIPRAERSSLLAEKISEYMKEHISEKITFGDIAAEFSVSPTTLKKLFKKHFGCGTIEHLTAIRIDSAKELLRSGNYSCTEISSMCGFCSIHHFSKVFKEKCGMSPTEYVKTVKSMLEYH
ncbi:MAG: helix-turn-helix transcriptional regulator [Clostridia bacterium]|nr:helix-turn-helix transcriptional regulator [Clostridia bacterium]